MEWLAQFGITLITTFATVFFLMFESRKRWIHWAEWLQTEEMIQLRREVANLTKQLRDVEAVQRATTEERNNLLEELLEAKHEIKTLNARILELERDRVKARQGVRVLGVWPVAPGLNQQGEANAAYNAGFDYIALMGNEASKNSVLHHLRNDGAAIFEIGAHSMGDSVPLADGPALPGWWERVLRGRDIRIAVLLTCYSDNGMMEAIRRALPNAWIVAVSGEISDAAAVEFARAFYANYANGLEVPKAVEEAKLVLEHIEAQRIKLR